MLSSTLKNCTKPYPTASVVSGAARALSSASTSTTTTAQCFTQTHTTPATSTNLSIQTSKSISSTTTQTTIRHRSTNPKINIHSNQESNSPSNPSSSKTPPNHPQPFVKVRLIPGEWDPNIKIRNSKRPYNRRVKPDPLYRPPWQNDKNAPRIISAEDYANRPRISFETEFKSLHDGMIILGHLGKEDREGIYDMYLKMMTEQDAKFGGVTSHEYVVKVIAQKYNIMPSRVAAVVQNAHDVEQTIARGEKVNTKLQDYVDKSMAEMIEATYDMYKERAPTRFIEDPASATVTGEKRDLDSAGQMMPVDDLYDVTALLEKAKVRERDEMQLAIDGHIYKEDVEEETIPTKINSECKQLMELKNKEFAELSGSYDSFYPGLGRKPAAKPKDGDDEEDTPKFRTKRKAKYVAKIINTRQQQKTGGQKSRKGYKNSKHDNKDNTLVEEDGVLRAATRAEVNMTPWKAEREPLEFIMRGVKAAWMDRKKNGTVNGWGKVPRPDPVEEAVEAKMIGDDASEEVVEEEVDGDTDAGTDDDTKE